MTFLLLRAAAAVLVGSGLALVVAQEPGSEAGLVALQQALLDARADAVVLNVAAHPDDESSRTNTILRRRYGARVITVYSTFGEGGQNAIGREIGPALARLRVRETLRAAALADVEVRWLGMSDFGFSKTLEETLDVWGADRLKARMREVIEETDPDVILTNHKLDQGHGHHRASHWAVVEVLREFVAAGRREPHLYVRCGLEDADVVLDPAEVEPIRGETFARLAHRAWTQHQSQGPWSDHNPLRVGKDYWRLAWPEQRPEVIGLLANVRARGAAQDWVGVGRTRSEMVEQARQLLRGYRARRQLDPVEQRRADALQRVVLAASGIHVESWLEREQVPVGGEGRVFVFVHGARYTNGLQVSCGGRPADPIDPGVRLSEMDSWPASPQGVVARSLPAVAAPRDADGDGVASDRFAARFEVAGSADVWQQLRPGWVELQVDFELDGLPIRLRPRHAYTPVRPIEVAFDRQVVFVPRGGDLERTFGATVEKHRAQAVDGAIRLMMGPGMSARSVPGRLALGDEHPDARLLVRVTFDTQELAAEPSLRMEIDGHEARLEIVPVDVEVPEGLTVGLVRGPDDTVERALDDLGIRYVALDRDALATTRLSDFSTLLLDMRAYHHRPELAEMRDRILQYCRAGGRVVSMYHKPGEWNERAGHPLLAPFPLEVGNDRVTEEDAVVTMLQPDHRLWRHPHVITAEDFDGWVQERGLNFPGKWDSAWSPLLEMKDRGEAAAHRGALLHTSYGRGDFVYCSLVLYRQLRVGHTGAARLLVNLLSP